MANILEFLRVLLSDGEQQRRFVADPHGYLRAHQFEHLSGEDVAEAIPVLMRSLPDPLTERLEPYQSDDDEALPPVRPLVGESDLDAAVRQLTFATSLTIHGAATPPDTDTADAEEIAPFLDEVPSTAGGEDDVEVAAELGESVIDDREGDAEIEVEPVLDEIGDVDSEGRVEAEGATGRAVPEPVMALDADGRIDPHAAFGDELASIVRFATQKMEELTRTANERYEAIIATADREAEGVRSQADDESNSVRFAASEEAHAIRSAAQADAQNLRQTAQAEADAILQAAKSAREEARIFKQAAKDDANAVLQSARSTQEDAQRHAADLIKNAERESSAMLAEARARRDEIREAERQLRKRLQGVESVFRTLEETSTLPEDDEKPVS